MLDHFSEEVKRQPRRSAIVFSIGRALKGRVDNERCRILNQQVDLRSIKRANQAVSFFEDETKRSLDVVRTWTHVGIRLRVVKDVRVMIAKLVWASLWKGIDVEGPFEPPPTIDDDEISSFESSDVEGVED